LALIRTRMDIRAEQLRLHEAMKGGFSPRRHPDLWRDDMLLSVFDGVAETDAVTMPPALHPVADRMPDGRWLVAASRAGLGEKNGRIHAADGRMERTMILGDGIENLFCAPDGTIWVGYFDEGVFGGPHKDGSWPVSSGGIVQFDASGRVLWSFNDRVGEDRPVVDSYAMTLSGSDVWACFYIGFPIVRVRGGEPQFWANAVDGASAIAVNGDLVLLGGGYGAKDNHIAVVKREGDTSRKIGTLRYAPGKPTAAGLMQGRGDMLHIVSDGVWYKVGVDAAAAAIGHRGA
jgi:hypothetical protein